jgi:retron-type reverse transcriptase
MFNFFIENKLFLIRTYNSELAIRQKTSLYKIFIKLENLQKAFKFLKLMSNPEIDGYTKTTFKSNLNKSLEKLNQELKNFTYKPSPVKITSILKHKTTIRKLGIPTIRDKIVQTSLFNLLAMIYEPIFFDCSYGFRPKKNCHSVLKQIKKK